jgi:hypothetical protein
MAYVEGEMPISYGYNNGWGNGDFGGIWGLLAIAIIFGGFGGNGFGWGNNGNGYQQTANVESSIHSALDTLQITNKLDGITTDLNTDFGNVINAITTNGYENRLAMNDLGFNMQNCCCQTRETINAVGNTLGAQMADLKYTIATEECATRQAAADNTQRIIDFMTQEKLATLTAENVALRGELSQNAQTNTIVNALRTPNPVPAYVVSNPYGCGCNGTSIQ